MILLFIGAAITVTVESSGSAIYVPEKTAFNCSFTTTYNLTQVTWTRTFGGQNETVYIDTNGSGTALGNLSMRADGELGERFHILHVHNVTVYDSGTYYCLVEDANNDTDSGNVFVDIYCKYLSRYLLQLSVIMASSEMTGFHVFVMESMPI